MSVNLCGRQVFVSKHLLNRPKVGTPIQKMGGEGMTQYMRTYRLPSYLQGVPSQHRPHAARTEPFPPGAEEKGSGVWSCCSLHQGGPAFGQIGTHRGSSRRGKRQTALLTALPQYHDARMGDVDVVDVESAEFGDPETGPVHHLQEGPVPEADGLVVGRRLAQARGFVGP
jgi:hypothetical protein